MVLVDQTLLISQIEEVGADIGEPDCKLTEPFLINADKTLTPWLIDITDENQFMISSDKILTLVEPNSALLNKYQDLLK
jgi:hypothetical protein